MHKKDFPFLSKMDPNKFFEVQFKNFGQQQDFTKNTFNFCTQKNADERELAEDAIKGVDQPAKKKKILHPGGFIGGDDNDDPE